MKPLRIAAALALAVTVGGCAADGATAPAVPATPAPLAARQPALRQPGGPNASLLSDGLGLIGNVVVTTVQNLTAVEGLRWTVPVLLSTTESRTIGPAGGSFGFTLGLKVIVPKGAVSAPTKFSVTRLAGSVVAYQFEPHGTTFDVPLVIEQPTLGTNFSTLADQSAVAGAYYPDPSLIDQASGLALVTEVAPASVLSDKSTIRFSVPHFSGWMLSSGIVNY